MDHVGIGTRKGDGGAILELKSLIRWHRVGRNSAGNPKISGSVADRIAKASIYSKKRKSDTDLRIGEI